MESCPRCGAVIEEDAGRCAVCGAARPVAAAEPARPLPPLPDGGLAAALPAWLREPPAAAPAPPLLTEADLPPWLQALARRDDADAGEPPTPDARAPGRRSADSAHIEPLVLPAAPLPPATVAASAVPHAGAPPAGGPKSTPPAEAEPAGRQRVGLATAVLLVLLALLILLAWASGVRLPGLS